MYRPLYSRYNLNIWTNWSSRPPFWSSPWPPTLTSLLPPLAPTSPQVSAQDGSKLAQFRNRWVLASPPLQESWDAMGLFPCRNWKKAMRSLVRSMAKRNLWRWPHGCIEIQLTMMSSCSWILRQDGCRSHRNTISLPLSGNTSSPVKLPVSTLLEMLTQFRRLPPTENTHQRPPATTSSFSSKNHPQTNAFWPTASPTSETQSSTKPPSQPSNPSGTSSPAKTTKKSIPVIFGCRTPSHRCKNDHPIRCLSSLQ